MCEQVVRERSVILTDVEPFTTYDVIVAAGNRDVISLPSVPAHITTLGMYRFCNVCLVLLCCCGGIKSRD